MRIQLMMTMLAATAVCAIAAEGPRVERRKPLTANVGVAGAHSGLKRW